MTRQVELRYITEMPNGHWYVRIVVAKHYDIDYVETETIRKYFHTLDEAIRFRNECLSLLSITLDERHRSKSISKFNKSRSDVCDNENLGVGVRLNYQKKSGRHYYVATTQLMGSRLYKSFFWGPNLRTREEAKQLAIEARKKQCKELLTKINLISKERRTLD